MFEYQEQLWAVITLECAFLICCISNAVILNTEIQKRRKQGDSNLFTSRISKWSPILSLISGVAYPLLGCLRFLNYSCYVAGRLFTTALSFQSIFLGLYQLDRLFYCFSQRQVHSAHGYPLWVFVFMGSVGVILAIYSVIVRVPWSLIASDQPGHCGLDRTGTYHDTLAIDDNSFALLYSIGILCYTAWDIATLLLYAVKVRYLRKHIINPTKGNVNAADSAKIEARIMRILRRVLILTFVYEIVVFIYASALVIGTLVNSLQYELDVAHTVIIIGGSMAMSLSVFLMQQHNDEEYQKFLEIIARLRVHYVFCFCCLPMIRREINIADEIADNSANHAMMNVANRDCDGKSTVDDTHDDPVKLEHSQHPDIDLSIDTISVV